MKITRNFAPVTIVLEFESDLVSFRKILDLAYTEARSRRSVFSKCPTDTEEHIMLLRQKV